MAPNPMMAETLATLRELGADFDNALDDVSLNRPVPKPRLVFENASRRLAMGVAGYLPALLTAAENGERYRVALEDLRASLEVMATFSGPQVARLAEMARKALETP